jgi:isorenieratene synthase
MAAIHLAERGLAPLVLEADPHWIGGRLRDREAVAFAQAGQHWHFPGEHGVHGIWAHYRNFKATLDRLALLPTLVPAREETWIFGQGRRVRRARVGSAIRGSLLPAPFHYLYCFLRPSFLNMLTLRDIIALPRVLMTLFVAMGIDPLAERRSLHGTSLADLTRLWPPRLRGLFTGLARSGLSAHPDEVPASGWIAFLRFYTLLRRDAWGFAYLPGTGGACVAEPLAAVAQQHGAEVRLGWRAEQLRHAGDGWEVVAAHDDTASHTTLLASHVILATDAPAAARLLTASPATAEIAHTLRFHTGTATAVIRLWFSVQPRRGAEAGIYSGDFAMDNFFWLHRLQPAYRDWSSATGGSAIEMHVYASPDLLALPDEALLARVIDDTYRAFPELADHLVYRSIARNEPTHTLFAVGRMSEHLGVLTPWRNLFACGDWVYHPSPALFLERATVTGIAAANATLSCCGLPPWNLHSHPRPELLAGLIATLLQGARQVLRRQRNPAQPGR